MILGTTCNLSEETHEEPIVVLLEEDLEGVLLNIRRASDNFYLDFADNIFKDSGWTTLEQRMDAMPNPVYHRRQYQTVFKIRKIENKQHDDVYFLEVNCAHSALTPIIGEIHQGWWVTMIELIPSLPNLVWSYTTRTLTSFGTLAATVATAVWGSTTRTLTSFGSLVSDIVHDIWSATERTLSSFGTLINDVDVQLTSSHGSGTWRQTNISDLEADVKKVLMLLGKNKRILNVVHDTDGNLLSATVRGYLNATDAQNDENQVIEINVTGTALAGFQTGLLEVES